MLLVDEDWLTVTLASLFGVLLALYVLVDWSPRGPGGERLPPGPWGLPLLGYLPFLGHDASETMSRLRKRYGDLITVRLGSHLAVVINGADALRDLLSSDKVNDRPDLKSFCCINRGRSVSFIDYSPAYRLHRKVCVAALADLSHPTRGPLGKILRESAGLLCSLLEAEINKNKTGNPSTEDDPCHLTGENPSIDPSLALQTGIDLHTQYDPKEGTADTEFLSGRDPFSDVEAFPWDGKPDALTVRAIDPSQAVQTAVMAVMFRVSFGADLSPETSPEFHVMREALDKFDGAMRGCAPGDFLTFLQPLLSGKYEQFRQINQQYTAAIQQRIDRHLETYTDKEYRDGLDTLIHSLHKYGQKLETCGLTRRDILHSVQDFVGAGTENSHVTLLWVLQYLARYLETQEEVYQEISSVLGGSDVITREFEITADDRYRLPVMCSFIQEVQRLTHTAPFGLPHATKSDMTYKGHFIPGRTLVLANLKSVLMDEELFPEATVFKPKRFLKKDGSLDQRLVDKLPVYGLGKRRCIGENLAKNELFYLTAFVVKSFRLREDPLHPLTLTGSLQIIYKPDPFKVIIEKRQN